MAKVRFFSLASCACADDESSTAAAIAPSSFNFHDMKRPPCLWLALDMIRDGPDASATRLPDRDDETHRRAGFRSIRA
jgi:hypothetical protein